MTSVEIDEFDEEHDDLIDDCPLGLCGGEGKILNEFDELIDCPHLFS